MSIAAISLLMLAAFVLLIIVLGMPIAFATGLINLGYTIGGMPSGWIQEKMGYAPFFLFVMALAIP